MNTRCTVPQRSNVNEIRDLRPAMVATPCRSVRGTLSHLVKRVNPGLRVDEVGSDGFTIT